MIRPRASPRCCSCSRRITGSGLSPKLSEIEESIRKGRQKRPRLLLELWQAIRCEDQAGFADALQRSLEYFATRSDGQGRANDVVAAVAIAESVFNLAAMEQGLQQANLPQPLADLLVTPESVGGQRLT